MQVSHKISFPGNRQFEQHTAMFTLSTEDVPADVMSSCSVVERMFILNMLVLYEGLLFQLSEGYISYDDFNKRKKRLFSILPKHLVSIVSQLLTLSGGENGS